jgi:hypothetical protein
MNTLRRHWPIFFLGAVTLLFFWQYFLLDQVLYAGDSVFVMTPFRQFVHESILRGELPLWNPYLLGGTPGLAEAQYQVFYLPNAIFFLLGVPRGMAWLLPLHLLFMAAGTYLFCRHALRLERAPAVFAAVAFSFGGYIQSRLGTWVYVEAVAWLPWMLWFYNRALDGKRLAWAGVVVALALQICVGGPQFSYYTLALIFTWHIYRWLEVRRDENDADENESRSGRHSFQKRWVVFPLVVLLGASLSAAQVLPQLELGRFSARGVNATYEYATHFSLAPLQFLVTSVLPGYYGLFDEAPREGFVPAEETSYLGLLTLAFIIAALVLAKPRGWVLVAGGAGLARGFFWRAHSALSVFVSLRAGYRDFSRAGALSGVDVFRGRNSGRDGLAGNFESPARTQVGSTPGAGNVALFITLCCGSRRLAGSCCRFVSAFAKHGNAAYTFGRGN